MNGWCLLLVCVGAAIVGVAPLSPLRIRKIAQHLKMSDRSGDNILQMIDYKMIADNIMEIPHYDKVNASYIYGVLVFEAWAAYPKKNSTLEELVYIWENTDPAALKEGLAALAKIMYDVWDCREPIGCLDEQELKYQLEDMGKVNDLAEQAKVALEAMDEDKDRCASLKEYQEAGLCYFTSEDESDPHTQFLGILDEY